MFLDKVMGVFTSKTATMQLILSLADNFVDDHKDEMIQFVITKIPVIRDTATAQEIIELFEAGKVFKAKFKAVLTA